MIKRKFLLTQLFILYGGAVVAQDQTQHSIILNESIKAYFENDGSPVILIAMNDVSKRLDVIKTLPRVSFISAPLFFCSVTKREASLLKMAGGVHTIDTISHGSDTFDVSITYKRYFINKRGKTFLNHHYYASENTMAPCGNYAGPWIIDNGPKLFRRYYYDKTKGTWTYLKRY